MRWIIIVMLMVICVLLVLCYALCVIASEADERAERMYKKWREEHKDKIRQGNLGKHGKQRKVICLDDGKVFDSYNEAGKHYGISDKTVKACCERKSQGKRKTFRYADGEREGE